jgi:uncharacterized protein YceK
MKVLVLAGVVLLCGGCSTFFNASVPASAAGSRYAVGSKAGFNQQAAVWLCPDSAGEPAECDEVEITEK